MYIHQLSEFSYFLYKVGRDVVIFGYSFSYCDHIQDKKDLQRDRQRCTAHAVLVTLFWWWGGGGFPLFSPRSGGGSPCPVPGPVGWGNPCPVPGLVGGGGPHCPVQGPVGGGETVHSHTWGPPCGQTHKVKTLPSLTLRVWVVKIKSYDIRRNGHLLARLKQALLHILSSSSKLLSPCHVHPPSHKFNKHHSSHSQARSRLSATRDFSLHQVLSVQPLPEIELVCNQIPTTEFMFHHFSRRSIGIVSDHFDEYAIKKQDFMETDEQIEKVVALIPDEGTCTSLSKLWRLALK